MMDINGVDNLLGQMRAAAAMAANKPAAAAAVNAGNSLGGVDFSSVLKNSIDSVNDAQTQASSLARDYELGKSNVNLQDVMVSMSKANIHFQKMVQVRNRVVSAYSDIMNMQV
jgi:flagellar hook-basal body complex protein FliE